MTAKEAYDFIFYHAMEVYEKREAKNIAKYFFEDIYGMTNFSDTKKFEGSKDELEAYAKRIRAHEPLQYITGLANFYGYNYKVNQYTLIPRPETEELVATILEDLKDSKLQYDLLDVGTGTGCIPITLKLKKRSLRVFGVEYSLDALNVARKNARHHEVDLPMYRMDFLDESYWDTLSNYDILVSNPPYVALSEKSKMNSNVLEYEPDMALFIPDDNYLIFYEKLAKFGLTHLNPDGTIYMELNEYKAMEIKDVFELQGYNEIEIIKDLQDKHRIIKVKK